jgi:hypothetical protein
MDITLTLPASRFTVMSRLLSGVSAIAEPRSCPVAVVVQAVGPPELVLDVELELMPPVPVLELIPPVPVLELMPPAPLLELVVVLPELELVLGELPPVWLEVPLAPPPPHPPAAADAAKSKTPSPRARIPIDLMRVSFNEEKRSAQGTRPFGDPPPS